MEKVYRPELLFLGSPQDKHRYTALIVEGHVHFRFDTIEQQMQELFKVRNPAKNPSPEEYDRFIRDQFGGRDADEYGVWVYFPWSKRLVHLLPENEFIEVRTNRNRLKITEQEQLALQEKKIGIIGLSVGQSIALTMAMERVCGALKLADYDTVELSNLNRIRAGVHDLGLNKTILAAREIAEIDPFIDVEIVSEGINPGNIEEFVSQNGPLDVLVEVCDNLGVKLKSRLAARKWEIPVIMETNDRCMLDIERFDIEPNRPLLHGLVSDEDIECADVMSNEQRMALVLKIVDGEQLSDRMKQSFGEIGSSLRSWPQLASSVTLGGGVTTDVARKLLLKEDVESGRYYIDIDEILSNKAVNTP